MSYAIETKKRKFERILESLTDHVPPQNRASLNTRNNSTSTLDTTTTTSAESSKRRRVTSTKNLQRPAQASTASLTTHYLPSSRLAFLERLETFRQVTKWHIPSTSVISAAEWAKRGWVCQDTDIVSCPSCKERLHVDVDRNVPVTQEQEINTEIQEGGEGEDPLEVADAFFQGLLGRYRSMIVTAHAESCPWRRRGCDNSIQRIEGLLNVPTALGSIGQRYSGISQDATEVPEVMSLPNLEHTKIDEQELVKIQLGDQQIPPNLNLMRLAVCGWQLKENDIIECRHCFRSLGLWLYRGRQPTVEHLDAIDSHLDYCPWRSETAQDTELSLPDASGNSIKEKRPGWFLNYLAIVKRNNKGRHPSLSNSKRDAERVDDENTQPPPTPEQREKRMKDLMTRIRDLKRPFHVKSLLKRKEKT